MKFIYVFITAMLLSSCGASVAVDYDKNADFTTYQTFQFYKPERTQLNELDINRVEAAIESVLVAKSWQRTDYNQYYISFYAENLASARRNTIGVGLGTGGRGVSVGGGFGIPIGAKKFSQKLTIQIFEATQGQPLVWEGSLEQDLKENASPKEKEAHFNNLVAKILAKFPPETK